MGQKSKIKSDVIRPFFVTCIRAVRKHADEAAHSFVPRAEPDDREQTLHNVTYCLEDSGIRLHGFNNVERVHESRSPTGYVVQGLTGETLVNYMLAPVRRAFANLPRVHTYVMSMDKGPFMPVPKLHTQKNRTAALLDTMERQQIAPIVLPADGSVPKLVSADSVLPPWIAVRANRNLYRHATDQMLNMILDKYKPPPGKRLIIDAMDMAATSPATLDEWMVSDRIVVDDYALGIIARTRDALRTTADWRAQTSRVVKELAQGGHVKSVPICLETSDDGITYAPFPLRGAANQCGEGDVGILFWLDAMQADKQHITLAGDRHSGKPIPAALAHYYDEEDVAEHNAIVARTGPAPVSVDERRQRAEALLQADPDLILQQQSAVVRNALADATPLSGANPCRTPNRGFVMSIDTDFLSLVPMYYAQMVHAHDGDRQYCLDNAPLLCIGECRVTEFGWLRSLEMLDTEVQHKKRAADGDDDDDDDGPVAPQAVPTNYQRAHEVYDVARMHNKLMQKFNLADAPYRRQLECAVSFTLFCATCENDYMAGLYYVNRKHMFEAFCAIQGDLVRFDVNIDGALIVPTQYQAYLKNCYYNSLMAARGAKNKPSKPAAHTTYAEMAAIVKNKYKGATSSQKHMPDDTRRELMYERLQWWLVYATDAWRSIDRLLDHTLWGWRPGTIDILV